MAPAPAPGDPTHLIRPAQRPTLRRWLRQRRSPYSILRALQYERLETVALTGRVLDIGGGERASYRQLLHGSKDIASVNIDISLQPTVVVDLNDPLPFADASFDTAISLNTFEHIRRDLLAVGEMLRVLRPGGTFHVFVPFLYRVHGSPADYHRHTASWWVAELLDLGADARSLQVEPLVWDPLATAYSIVEFAPLRSLLRPLALLRAAIRLPLPRRPKRPGRWSDYAIGYYVTGARGR